MLLEVPLDLLEKRGPTFDELFCRRILIQDWMVPRFDRLLN